MVKRKEQVHIFGVMARCILGNGKRIGFPAKASISDQMEECLMGNEGIIA